MHNETMTLEQLATYLKRDVREVSKLASRGHLPGQKVAGQWRFSSAEMVRVPSAYGRFAGPNAIPSCPFASRSGAI